MNGSNEPSDYSWRRFPDYRQRFTDYRQRFADNRRRFPDYLRRFGWAARRSLGLAGPQHIGAGLLLLFLLALSIGAPAGAARSREFCVSSVDGILKGELDGIAARPEGAILPAPASKQVLSGEVAYVWSLLPDGKGGVYAATGSEGHVYHIHGDGSCETLAKTFEYELFALTRAMDGNLYVSGAPNGTVTRILADGSTETVIDLPEGLVWDLLASPKGDLFVAAGESGEIYRIRSNGETEPIGRVPDMHVVCLSWWEGRILCGTDGRGILAALDPRTGELEVLFDTSQEEVVAILPLGSERVIFAANGSSNTPEGSETGSSFMLPPIAIHANGVSGQSTIYELGPEGLIRPVWKCPDLDILCLALAPDGTILAGTGDNGVLYSLDAHWNATRLVDFDEDQLLSVASDGQRVFVGTGNGGAVYQLDWEARREGIYTSRVWDAGLVSTWGTPHWIASGKGDVVMETRCGRLREPGESWSEWQALQGGRVASPPGRFLQWRMQLKADQRGDLRIRTIRVPYRGPNRSPQVSKVRVSPKAPELVSAAGTRPTAVRQKLRGGIQVEYTLGEAGNSGNGASPERTGLWSRSLRTAVWEGKDPDGDQLRYDLFLRLLEDEEFLPLKLDIEEQAFTWDAAAWPEGWYELRVVARDEESNPPGEGLEAERLSGPFEIDNTPPRLRDLRLEIEDGDLILSGKAVDEISRIRSLEFSLNGEGWRMALPIDGMLDSRSESFRIVVPRLEDGRYPAVLGARVSDEVGHLATARLRVPQLD